MTFHYKLKVFRLIMANNIIFAIILLTVGCYHCNALPSDDNPHSLSLSKLSTAKYTSSPPLLSSTYASLNVSSTSAATAARGSSITVSTTTASPMSALLPKKSQWTALSNGFTSAARPSSAQDEITVSVADRTVNPDNQPLTPLNQTKRLVPSKIRKVVKKLKKAKYWKALDQINGSDDTAEKWIPLWNTEKDSTKKGKSSKRIVCVHIAPSRQEQSKVEQFNLVRKCYSVKHIKRADTLDTSSSSYSPIIDPNQMLIRSPVMSPSASETVSPITAEEEEKATKDFTTEPAIDVIPPTNSTEPEVPPTTEKSKQPNYLNLYEYQTTNPLSSLTDSTVVEKPTQIDTPSVAANAKKTNNEKLDQSPSEYFPIVTDIVTLDNTHIQNVDVDSKTDAEVQTVAANDDAIARMNASKDLWSVKRRKKQLREMTMVSRSREVISSPSSETSPDSSSSPSSMSSSRLRKIPKLLLFKVNRPAMYSLNGYVPKPSLHRVAPTSRPAALLELSNKLMKSVREQVSKRRRRKNNNQYTYNVNNNEEEEEADEIEVSESVSSPRRRHSGGDSNGLVPRGNGNNNNNNSTSKRSKKIKKSAGPLRQWPALSHIPKTGFECSDKRIDGVYADVETGCQVWHVCQNGAHHSFLCPSGTIFNAKNGVCDWWYNTRCA